jgi:hypothetical protein
MARSILSTFQGQVPKAVQLARVQPMILDTLALTQTVSNKSRYHARPWVAFSAFVTVAQTCAVLPHVAPVEATVAVRVAKGSHACEAEAARAVLEQLLARQQSTWPNQIGAATVYVPVRTASEASSALSVATLG